MENLIPLFHKTITIANILQPDVLKDFTPKDTNQTEIHQEFYQHTKQQFQASEHSEMITQILDIELEKFALSSKQIDEKIHSDYARYNLERETILQLDETALNGVTLQQNPYVECYAANCKFVILNETDQAQLFAKILDFPKDEYYFIFQRTDVFDPVLQTNVLEFQLTKYEYYVLQLFQDTATVEKVMDAFIDVFEVETEEEFNSLKQEATRIIKFLIFRKFLVNNE
jgi:hypothetical protein